ncbi:MAG TPA: chemotaxis protein CheW [Isosphaeraceae bacterium]|jgi:purine-binding chemotaxis protein CheW|nr:chemotaxis protein CheW [Isosphaeraceae bacterium]
MATLRQFCTFSLAELLLGLEVSHVQEVLRHQEMTSVPLAPQMIRGLINLRGQIVMAVDLRRRLELSEPPADLLPMNVVMRTGNGALSLLVDAIHDVIELPDDALEPPPETLRGAPRRLIRGAYPLHDRLLLCLDADQIVAMTAERPE